MTPPSEPASPISGTGLPFGEEARYRLLVDAVTDYAIYMLDPTGLVVSWNPGAQRLKGYAASEILGRSFSTFYTPEDRAADQPQRALDRSRTEGRFEAEGWRVRKDGKRFWALVVIDPIRAEDGSLLGYAKVTRDLSERREAEQALRRSEEQFRRLVQGVTDYAIYMLDLDGRIVSWNTGAERIKGYRADEVVGGNFSRFYRSEERAAGAPAAALATAAREGRFEAEAWRVRRDGSEFRAHVVIDPIHDDAGLIVGFAKITRDVTRQYRAQQELDRAREALFQAQKLDAIGQLTGGVAHDFNNLLMVIMSSLSLAKKHLPDDDRLRRLLDNALSGARRGATLTQRMLAFARRQELTPTVVHLPALIDGMIDMVQRTLGVSVRLQTEFPIRVRPVRVDANQLELALLNLLVNARDAMPDGGQLLIRAQEDQITEASGLLAAGRYVRLSVVDSGAGMDTATLGRAAEPFFTTKGAGKGTGLGLPMVHGLAVQSGGRFLLESEPGVGTTASLWLPVAEESAPQEAPNCATSTSVNTAPLLVLVVDDDALVLGSTCAVLEELGHSVVQTSSGDDALRLLRSKSGFDLLVTDHVMPRMTGAQLIALVAQELPHMPAILATGYAELLTSLPPAAVRLAKPFDQQDLTEAVGEALRRKGIG